MVQPASLTQTLVYPKEQALLDICRREVQTGNQIWVFVQMTGKRDLQPRLKQILAEAGFHLAIMRSRSVKTRDRLEWIEKEGKKNDIVISHPQLVQNRLGGFWWRFATRSHDYLHRFANVTDRPSLRRRALDLLTPTEMTSAAFTSRVRRMLGARALGRPIRLCSHDSREIGVTHQPVDGGMIEQSKTTVAHVSS